MVLCRVLAPRALSAVWAVFAAATSVGYYGRTVSALTPVESVLPAGSPMLAWMAAAVLLAVGAIIPPSRCWARAGRAFRITGIAIAGALLAMWAVSFGVDAIVDGSRMWVSAKNYVMLAMAAMGSGALMGRDRASQ